jgi:hypothetical protein
MENEIFFLCASQDDKNKSNYFIVSESGQGKAMKTIFNCFVPSSRRESWYRVSHPVMSRFHFDKFQTSVLVRLIQNIRLSDLTLSYKFWPSELITKATTKIMWVKINLKPDS